MSINTKTYLTKTNTIIKDSNVNTGLNPVMELSYGERLTRGLLFFDHTKLQSLVEDKTYPEMNKLKHTLKMFNASSVNNIFNKECGTINTNTTKHRANSFDLILFLLPKMFDNGKGYDYNADLHLDGAKKEETNGSNWFNYQSFKKWEYNGIYPTEFLSKELDKFTSKDGSSDIIIAYEHFDLGNETLEIDVTETVNKFITNEIPNNGIGIAFSPLYEEQNIPTQFVSFFTPHTHTFFEPYIETTYDDYINDDRNNFYLNKDNKLYFYAIVGGKNVNLDTLPICTIEGREYASKQATKGVYYIDINLSSDEFENDTMYYDIWTNIYYKGKHINDVELTFTTLSNDQYFNFGLPSENTDEIEIIPSLSGINHMEQIKRGDIRKINVSCKIPYTSNQEYNVENLEYRLYVIQGNSEIDVIKWCNVEKSYNNNYFVINTNDLIPFRYFIDIKIKYNDELIIHNKQLAFDVINDKTDTPI